MPKRIGLLFRVLLLVAIGKMTSEADTTSEDDIEIIPRDKWNPLPLPRPPDRLKVPVIAVFWTKTATRGCKDEESCLKVIGENQLFHLQGGQFDTPFNFLIGGDGRIYEGRGWYWASLAPFTKKEVIDMTPGPYFNRSLIIGHIGRKIVTDPEDPMTQATMKFIEYGIKKNLIVSDYETFKKPYWIKY